MSDEELTARLRGVTIKEHAYGAYTRVPDPLSASAADRIEDLTKERDTAREYAGEVRIREKVAEDARIEAEAKLAKAAEMLEAALKYNSAMHGGVMGGVRVQIDSRYPISMTVSADDLGSLFAAMNSAEQVAVLDAMIAAMQAHPTQWDHIAIELEKPENAASAKSIRDTFAYVTAFLGVV